MLPSSHPFPLEAHDVSLARGGREVLSGVSLRLERAAVTTLVGPSGAGKSSLLRCLNRLEEPERGYVTLDGEDIRRIEPTALRKRIGMIFQSPVLFEGDVRANLEYGLGDVGTARLGAAMDRAGLAASFLERPSGALSLGQAQRACIARALLRDPEVLLMDEPTSALDKDASARIEDLIMSLAGRGLTVLLVTHDLLQARRVATAGALLVDGSIQAHGSLDLIEASWPRG
ncbi:MAG: phosphate ABC transporter ATP-binding protein, partial [Actinomycetota bacterium]|nr:phosphate ABC transporter ATP-binding protein [Actinomycetota bacterium]